MLPGLGAMMAGLGGVPPFGGTFVMTDSSEGAFSNHTGMALGAAAADRRMFAVVMWYRNANSAIALNSGTINGQAITVHAQSNRQSGSKAYGCAIVSAAVDLGTSGNVNLTFSTTVDRTGVYLFRADGLANSAPTDTITGQAGNSLTSSPTMDLPDSGFVLAVVCGDDATTPTSLLWGGSEDWQLGQNNYSMDIWFNPDTLAETGATEEFSSLPTNWAISALSWV